MDPYETKISDVLSSRAFLAKHPGSSQLGSDIYSSAVNSSSELMQRQRHSGLYVSNTNQLNFGAQSSFFLTPGSVMNGVIISGNVILPQYTRAPDLWALHAIESVELVISGSSSIQSLKINGRSHLEMVMATLDSNKLELLRKSNGYIDLQAAGATVKFSIPLQLFFSSAEMKSVFPLDTSTLQSQIIMNIRWKPNYQIFSGDTTNAVTLPAGFNDLYMRVADQVQISNDFALSNMLKMDQQLIYSLPGAYAQSYTQVVKVGAVGVGVGESQVSLTSQPSGHLQCILVSIREIRYEGLSSTQGLIQPFANFESIRVLYNGIEVYRADSQQEMQLTNATCTDKDNGINFNWNGRSTAVVDGIAPNVLAEWNATPVVIIPFANEISEVLRNRRHEHTKDYSGSTLQFFFTVAANIPLKDDTNPISGATPFDNSNGGGAQDYRCNFTFVNAGLYEISQQTVALEM